MYCENNNVYAFSLDRSSPSSRKISRKKTITTINSLMSELDWCNTSFAPKTRYLTF